MIFKRFCTCSLGLAVLVLLAGCGGGSSNNSGGNSGGNTTNPTVTSVSPTSVMAGSGSLTLTVNGTGFTSGTTVEVGGIADQTTYVSATQLTATVSAAQLATGGQLSVIVVNGSSSSGSGTPVNLQVTNPAPTITAVSPTVELAAAASPVVTITGTGFVSSTVIQVNGSNRTTTFANTGQVSVALTAADVASSGTLSLTAVNPAPGGGTSAAATLPVNNPLPGLGKLSAATVLTSATAPVTITITGSNYVTNSTVLLNGNVRTTTYISPTQISFQLAAADLATAQQFTVAVMNPAPGGGTNSAGTLLILQSTPAPTISSVSPTQFIVGSQQSSITVYGTNFFQTVGLNTYFVTATVQWNGTPLTTQFISPFNGSPYITATVPANLLTATGTANITVSSTTSTPSVSNSLPVTIVNPPPPTLTSIYPAGGPIDTATSVTLQGTGFTQNSTVALNGTTIPSTYEGSTELTATIPASSVTLPGNVNLTVTTPAPGGGTTAPLSFTAYLGITNNDMLYNATDGLLYASIPGSVSGMGNSVVGIDPVTGNIQRQLFAGSNPNKLALSTDGTQLFVGLDGAGAVAQISLSSGQVVNQFSLATTSNGTNSTVTADYLAAVPGAPNSVAVSSSQNVVTIYDSGVPRPGRSSSLTGTPYGYYFGALSFGASSSTLYVTSGNGQIGQMTVGSTGITAGSVLFTSSSSYYAQTNTIQFDNGNLYLSNGEVISASTGTLLGTFYATSSTVATGSVVSDSSLGRAFVAYSSIDSSIAQVLAFDETTFNQTGSISLNDIENASYPYAAEKIVRWGQNGVAINTPTQIYIFESSVVKDLSPSPADLAVTLTAPSTASTGAAITYTVKITNNGPNQAQDATLSLALDSSLIVNSVTPSQGTCGTGTTFACDLGQVANGSSVTVTVSATPTTSGTLAGVANVTSVSYDPTTTNNQATSSTTVTGTVYSPAPTLASISPALVQAGSPDFTLAVNGAGFNASSVVSLNGTALTTSYVNPTQLTAEVDATMIANYGWAAVTVSNPSPGGGTSQVTPLTIYDVLDVTLNSILYDRFTQMIYGTVPGGSSSVTGNSIVAINPVTGGLGTPVLIGSQPTVMAETSDGDNLFVALAGSDSLAQFNLINQSAVATIPVTYTPSGGTAGAVTPASLSVMPGNDKTLAMNFTNTWGNFGIFQITGDTGAFLPNLSGIYEGQTPVFATPTEIYSASSNTLYRYTVSATGLNLLDTTELSGMGGTQPGFDFVGGLLYGGGGGIANPTTTPPAQIATLALPEFYATGITESGVGAVADPSTQKDFVMEENAAGTWEYALARFNTTTYLPETVALMPQSASTIETTWTMLRWGQAGLALLSVPQNSISPQATAQLILLEGPFVTPQLLGANSAATLASSSTTSVTHGAGNTMLTLTGSNFAPGVAVTWNGSYRTTTIVDAAHVTVAIPASDLATAGSGSLVATNPGATASNTLTVTIN